MRILLGILCVSMLIGCGATKISSEEAFKYERMYAQQSSNIEKPKTEYKYVQAQNKKQACKIATSSDKTDDKDYKIFWDGDCVNGYAHGLGREFEIDDENFTEQIGIYEKGKPKDYHTAYNRTQNMKFEGYSNYDDIHYKYAMQVSLGQGDINIVNTWFYEDDKLHAIFQSSPFSDTSMLGYFNSLHNYAYRLIDYSNDEFSNLKSTFETLDSNAKLNGFAIYSYKNGGVDHFEFASGNLKRKKLSLPQDYLDNINAKLNEARKALSLIETAQKKAQSIESKYKSKICASKTKVSFMDNEKYMAICNDDKLQAEIYKLAQDKLALIEKQKAAKREQIYREKMIALQQQQQQQQAWDNLNRQINDTRNNINQQTQRMQQQMQHEDRMYELRRLNNNLQQINNKLGY